jgi:tRNA-2-methylthio-N6-dimethylallyladenosine synthase
MQNISKPNRKLYIESYGCQMNFADSEIVASIMQGQGFQTTATTDDADVIFLNTCAIRDNAELRIWKRLTDFKTAKRNNPNLIIGVLGCMAERLKSKLLEEQKLVDLVVGPDAYRDLPNLIQTVESGQRAVNVLLSREETYAEISPVRLGSNGISAFISITRGCDNMCSFCVVPFTRGRERSRDPETIVAEAKELFANGYKEVTLLGQNVDSYEWEPTNTGFAQLLEQVALISPELRVRFSTSHPKDMADAVLHTIAKYDNICNYIHLPVQSGNSRVLEMMNRGYTREWYQQRIETIRNIIPDCGISTDIITGFCSETEEEHFETLSLMDWVGYDFAYMFKYSERPGTLAARKYKDDIEEEIKATRLDSIIVMQQKLSLQSNKRDINKIHRVLVEKLSKKSEDHLSGRNSQNKVVVFPKKNFKPGDYVEVLVTDCTIGTLIGTPV